MDGGTPSSAPPGPDRKVLGRTRALEVSVPSFCPARPTRESNAIAQQEGSAGLILGPPWALPGTRWSQAA